MTKFKVIAVSTGGVKMNNGSALFTGTEEQCEKYGESKNFEHYDSNEFCWDLDIMKIKEGNNG